MKIVKYCQLYEQDVVELWNKCCSFDPITVNKFRLQALFDDNFDEELCLVAKDKDRIIGFILGTKRKFPYLDRGLEPDRGWINVMFVDHDYIRQGIGQRMYDETESKLISMGCKNITLGAYSPNYFFAGIDPEHYPKAIGFFEKNGYKPGEKHYSMGRNLHGYQISKEISEKKRLREKEGYEFIPFDYSYALQLLKFCKEEFGGGWKRNVLISMQKNVAENNIILVLKKKEICAFCMSAIDGNELRFGPIGVSAAERNQGIGGILLELKMYDMCKKGLL